MASISNFIRVIAEYLCPKERRKDETEDEQQLLALVQSAARGLAEGQNLNDLNRTIQELAPRVDRVPNDSSLKDRMNRALMEFYEQRECLSTHVRRRDARPIVDEKKFEPEDLAPELIVSELNQYRGGGAVSTCTSCAAAFCAHLKAGHPLSVALIDRSIDRGRRAHEQAAAIVAKRIRNPNLNAQQVIQHGDLGLREIGKAITGRPYLYRDRSVVSHYQEKIIPALRDKGRQRDGLTCAIFTHAPYSAAIARQIVHGTEQFIFFDSHGDEQTRTGAYIRTFNDSETLCRFLADKYGYDDEFPDVDVDNFGQDNPNCYELVFV